MVSMMTVVIILALAALPLLSQGIDVHMVRQLATQNNVTCILVFGDSSVDPGNNNRLRTTQKGNFPPYGKDFLSGRPTGRFTNGRLATDFVADAIGYTKVIPGFLDLNLKKTDLLHGVSFASAATGYDDLTANISSVLSVSKQLEYFRHYKVQLVRLVGMKKAEEIIRNAIVILSMGTNDFLQNYFLEPVRSKQYTVQEYQNYLIARMSRDIEEMHRLGATRLVIVGVPPMGCMPLVKTIMGTTTCSDAYNQAAFSFNSKIQKKLATFRKAFGMKSAFADAYGIILTAIQNPQKFGLTEVSKGCCGSGTYEYGDTCKGLSVCADRTKYVFWDAVHPTEKMYEILADEVLGSLHAELIR